MKRRLTAYKLSDAFGPELVTNGDFSSSSNWILNNNGNISGGTLNITNMTNNVRTSVSLQNGKFYRVKITFNSISSGGVELLLGGNNSGRGDEINTVGTYVQTIEYPTNASISNLYISAVGTFTGVIDNVSVKEAYLGPELISNGDFATSGTPNTSSFTLGWYSQTDGVEIANGKLTLTNSASGEERAYATDGVSSNDILTTNKIYKLTFDITDNTNCTAFQIYKDAGTFVSVTNNVGSYTYNITNTLNNLFIFRNLTANSSISIDNVSVKEILT